MPTRHSSLIKWWERVADSLRFKSSQWFICFQKGRGKLWWTRKIATNKKRRLREDDEIYKTNIVSRGQIAPAIPSHAQVSYHSRRNNKKWESRMNCMHWEVPSDAFSTLRALRLTNLQDETWSVGSQMNRRSQSSLEEKQLYVRVKMSCVPLGGLGDLLFIGIGSVSLQTSWGRIDSRSSILANKIAHYNNNLL